ncbi:hypothetical protein Lac2_27420 [Claveliimonas bilis]|uniref:hypothetical protein n=1 Tax=Claveliimonas bilis TaxID=3028070 RepID=UPI00292F2CF2|nr:hypothetical protein [Claveliimonas bilis]BDZ84608.1 hypothetical protein Lac2_27420 [Claveliimonas bilis]
MESFGLWYLLEERVVQDTENTSTKGEIRNVEKPSIEEPSIDLHVNFWSLEDNQTKNKKLPYLDIGIKIENYKLLRKMTFFCPFIVEYENVEDLSTKMAVKNNANIVFNTDCDIHTRENYTIIELSDTEKILVFPLDQVIKDVYSVKSGKDNESTQIEFDFINFKKYINSDSELEHYDKIYIRFRITGKKLKDNIYFDNEPINKSFESAFSGTRMIDFRINEKRTIDEKIRAEIIVEHEEFAKFRHVHFLAMEPSSYEVKSFDNLKMSCRELEEGLWDDYFGEKINFSKGHILAYHWKKDNADNGFNCLVKVNYSKTKISVIFAYALIVVALGIIGSAVVTLFDSLISDTMYAMVGAFFLAILLIIIGILIGKKITH